MLAGCPHVMTGDVIAAHNLDAILFVNALKAWHSLRSAPVDMSFCTLTARSSIAFRSPWESLLHSRSFSMASGGTSAALSQERGNKDSAARAQLCKMASGSLPRPPGFHLQPLAMLTLGFCLYCCVSRKQKCHNVHLQRSGHGDGKTKPVRIAHKRQAIGATC